MNQMLWIARHGNRRDFVDPSWLATAERFYDPPLSEDGIIQAKKLGQYLQGTGVTHIFYSPFRRTVETSYYVAEALDLPIKIESGLSEFLFPLWMPSKALKFPVNDLMQEFPRIDSSYISRVDAKYPEVSLKQLRKRTEKTVKCLSTEFSESILMITHEASIVGLIRGLIGSASSIDASSLCCLFKLAKINMRWNIEPHDYVPSPAVSSSQLSMIYLGNQIRQRFKTILD